MLGRWSLHPGDGLKVGRRRERRPAVGARASAQVLALSNQRWGVDFVHDRRATRDAGSGAYS
jgi:putative transposase